jgi:pseudaminic acid cytidylyltransferase
VSQRSPAIAIIPARGGSRRIHGKIFVIFTASRSLLTQSKRLNKAGFSIKSPSLPMMPKIMEVSRSYGANVIKRPAELAADEVGTQEVARNAIQFIQEIEDFKGAKGYDYACCIYPTAPMLSPTDLIRGYYAVQRPGVAYAFAVSEKPFGPAGMFYWGRVWAFLDRAPLEAEHSAMIPIPPERCIDINTEDDWHRAEKMYLALEEMK